MTEKHVQVIAGPDSGDTLAKSQARRPRLVDRVYAPRPTTTFEARARRLRKAIESQDVEATRTAARDMTAEERDRALATFGVETLRKGYWNPTSRKFDAQRPMENYNQRMPGDASRAAAPKAPTIAPQRETGFLRAVERGDIVNFIIDGERHHAKILKWGKTGATVVAQNGNVAHVLWADITMGVHAEAAIEHAQLVAKADAARAHRTTMRKSAGIPDDALYAMSPSDRERYLQERGA